MQKKLFEDYYLKYFDILIQTRLFLGDNFFSFNYFVNNILNLLKFNKFINETPEFPKITRFLIEVKRPNDNKLFKDKNNNFFKQFMRSNEKNKITTDYDISIYDFQMILFRAINICLARKNGLIIHASSVVDNDNNSFIFIGDSGSGKSTWATKMIKEENYQFCSDEYTVFEINSSNNIYSYPLPIIEKNSLKNVLESPSKKYKVKKVYFLKKGRFQKTKLYYTFKRNTFFLTDNQLLLKSQMKTFFKILMILRIIK